MLRFSKFKADSNKIVHQLLKPINLISRLPINSIKKSFCAKNTSKITERLSFLNSEEEMRKYFNIVDFDKKDADEIFNEELRRQQKISAESQNEFDNFDRKKLLEYINKYKSELQNMDQDEKQRNYFELVNEYSLPLEKLNFVKNKPNNYILVSNISSFESEEELIHFLERYGPIKSHNIVKDLNCEKAALEVFYEKDESAKLALKYLNNQNSNDQHFLKIKSNKDNEKEEVNNKTLIVKNINPSLTQEAVFQELSAFGHIMKFEMPLVNKTQASTKIGRIIDLGENYLSILTNSVAENTDKNSIKNQINQKARFNFYFNYLNKVISEFKNVLAKHEDTISLESQVNLLNNLLVEINFFLRKFFPDIIVNSLIKEEFEEIEKKKSSNSDFVTESLELRKMAFEKIIDNLEKLVKKYDQKLSNLSKPLTKEEILVDLQDFENGGRDPEKITEDFLKKTDGEEQLFVIKKLEDMKLYSSFYPLEQKIAKYNFFKSLTDEERKVLSERYNLSISINKPEFLDYFLKFNRAMGIEIFDKYIELSKLYIAMSPAEKVNHARNIIDNKYGQRNIHELKSGILDFLELKSITQQLNNRFDRNISEELSKAPLESIFDILQRVYKGLPRLTHSEFSKLLDRQFLINSKKGYLKFIGELNLKRNIYYARKIRKMIVVYNNDIKELTKNYNFVTDPQLKAKYNEIISKMQKSTFPNIFRPYVEGQRYPQANKNVGAGAQGQNLNYNLMDEEVTQREATLDDFKNLDNEPEIIKSAAREFKDHFKYTGKAMTENQIINRLEHLRTSIVHITEFIMNVTDKHYYKKLKMEKVDKLIKKKLKEDAEVIFADDLQLKAHYLKKINSELSKFSYVNDRYLQDKQYTFQEICEDLIYREYEYMQRVRVGMNLLSNVEKNLGVKVNKNNFVEAISVNGVLTHLNYEYSVNHRSKKYTRKHFFGSPTIAYMNNIHKVFKDEVEKVEKIKELKLQELRVPTLDEAQSTRAELIENYTSKIAEYEKLKKERIENEIKSDLDNYKFEFLINGENFTENLNMNNSSTYDRNNNHYDLDKQANDGLSLNGISNSALLDLEKELIKKEFEIIQNASARPEHLEDYKDVSSLVKNISTLQKEQSADSSESGAEDSIKTVDKILKRKRLQNKGYAFVTFITSDEAKRVYLEGQLGLKIQNKLCDIEPKFDRTHNSMDIQRLLDVARQDSILIGKEDEIKQAEQKILEFESKLDEKLDSKQREIKQVITAYRDLYSDPFKKHDVNNPFSKEEEERLKFSLKKIEEKTGVSNYWILEEDKLDELRRIKDKRITKTYLDWQLLKKGVVPESVLKSLSDSSSKSSSVAATLQKEVERNFSEKEKVELAFNSNTNKNNSYYNNNLNAQGRITPESITDKKAFIESYLGKDYIETPGFGFQPDNRDSAIYREIQDLRERFPKELFEKKLYGTNPKTEFELKAQGENSEDSMAVSIESLINTVNQKYVNIIQNAEEEKAGEAQMTKIDLLDRMTNLSPVNKKLQLIITERNRLLEDEDLKQSISIRNFIDRNALVELDKNAKLIDENSISKQYNTLQNLKYETSLSKKFWQKDPRTFYDPELELQDLRPQIVQEAPEIAEGDSSFAAFIARRKAAMDLKEKALLNLAGGDSKDKKTQFDAGKLSIEQIQEAQADRKNNAIENIRLKYQMHMSSVLNQSNNIDNNLNNTHNKNQASKKTVDENVFEYLKNKKSANKQKLEKFNEKIKVERKKAEFLAELERNFAKEIETLPSFREHFEALKNNEDPIANKIKSENFSVENLKELISYKTDSASKDSFRDMIALLSKGKLSQDEYEKYFVKQVQKNQSKLNDWLNEESKQAIIEEIKFTMGINKQNQAEQLRILQAKFPAVFDSEIDHLKTYRGLAEKIEYIENTEEYFESEYIFSAKSLDLLAELARISKLRNLNVSVRFDDAGKLIIRREFKNAYKYDLDAIINFDVQAEKQKLIESIKHNNFLSEFEKEARAVTKFLNDAAVNKISINEKREHFVDYVEKLIEAFDFKMHNHLSNPFFSFFDLKNAITNLENMPIAKVRPFINALINILNIPNARKAQSFEVTESLKLLAEFSNGVFAEREVAIIGNLILITNKNLEKGKNIPLIEVEFTAETRKSFINEVLIKSIEQNFEFDFTRKDMSVIKCLLRSESNFNDNLKVYNVVKSHLWNCYKKEMNEKYSLLFKKEKEINPAALSEVCGNIKDLFEIIKHYKAKDLEKINENEKNIQEEINSFSNKLQEYYIDVANMSNSNDYIENLVSDDELFFEEISEQIEKRIMRQKMGKINKNDLIKKRYNEKNLLRKQMTDIEKYEKYLEGLTLNDYFSENTEMLTELRRIITECKRRREALVSQGKPIIDYNFPRMI